MIVILVALGYVGPGRAVEAGLPVVGRAPSPSCQTYQSALGLSRLDLDSRNQGCWSEVWLSTRSRMTRMSRACASSRKLLEIVQGAVFGRNAAVVGDVVAAVPVGGGEVRREPEGVDAQVFEVIELFGHPWKSPMPSPLPSAKERG